MAFLPPEPFLPTIRGVAGRMWAREVDGHSRPLTPPGWASMGCQGLGPFAEREVPSPLAERRQGLGNSCRGAGWGGALLPLIGPSGRALGSVGAARFLLPVLPESRKWLEGPRERCACRLRAGGASGKRGGERVEGRHPGQGAPHDHEPGSEQAEGQLGATDTQEWPGRAGPGEEPALGSRPREQRRGAGRRGLRRAASDTPPLAPFTDCLGFKYGPFRQSPGFRLGLRSAAPAGQTGCQGCRGQAVRPQPLAT